MSQPEESPEPDQWVDVDATSEFEDDDEALEALVQLKDLDFSDTFTNRNTSLNPDQGQGISISFYHDEMPNMLSLSTDDDSNLSIRVYLTNSFVLNTVDVLEKILIKVKPITLTRITTYQEFDLPYRSLNLPIEEETEFNVIGLRIRDNQRDRIIQKDDDSDDVVVHMINEQEMEITDQIPEGLISDELEATEQLITEEL